MRIIIEEESADMFDYSEAFEHWSSVRNRYFVKKLIKKLHNFIAQSCESL